MPQLTYTITRLIKYATDNNITLIGEYEKTNRDTKITGYCITAECQNTFCKTFRLLIEKGAYCNECAKENGTKKAFEKQYIQNSEKLLKYAQENNIILFGKYVNINTSSRISGVCIECNTQSFDKAFGQLFQTGAFCNDCTLDNAKEKAKETSQKNYGCDNPSQNLEVQKKAKETSQKKYGCDYPMQNPEVRKKTEETNIKKYGTRAPAQNPEVRKKTEETNIKKYGTKAPTQNAEVQKKMGDTYEQKTGFRNPFSNPVVQKKSGDTKEKKTGFRNHFLNPQVQQEIRKKYKEKTGFDYPGQNPQVRKKMEDTYEQKTGFRNPGQNPEVQKKIGDTNEQKTGFRNPFSNPVIQEIIKQTNLKLYGCVYPMQNAEVQEKASKNAYKAYDYICPSGDIRRFQGYEKFGMNCLLKTYAEEDIFNLRLDVPELYWKDKENKIHRHFVDFFMPLENLCVEIKSTWTFEKKREQCLLKQKYAKKFGLKYEIWVFNKKGKLVEKLE